MRSRIDGEGQNRTVDTAIFSRVLYQLSYLAAAPSLPRRPGLRLISKKRPPGRCYRSSKAALAKHPTTPWRPRQGANWSQISLPGSASISSAALPRLIAIDSRCSESSNTTSSPLATSPKVSAQIA